MSTDLAPAAAPTGRPLSPNKDVPPGGPAALLQQWVAATGNSAAAVARALGISRQHLDRILSEDLRVTPEMALRIARWSDTNPIDWLARQALRDVQRLEADGDFRALLKGVHPWHQTELQSVEQLRALTEADAPHRRGRRRKAR